MAVCRLLAPFFALVRGEWLSWTCPAAGLAGGAAVLLATVSTITASARQLPLQNVLLAAFVIRSWAARFTARLTVGIPLVVYIRREAGPIIKRPWAIR